MCKEPGVKKTFISEKQRGEQYGASVDSAAGQQNQLMQVFNIALRIQDFVPSAMGKPLKDV